MTISNTKPTAELLYFSAEHLMDFCFCLM